MAFQIQAPPPLQPQAALGGQTPQSQLLAQLLAQKQAPTITNPGALGSNLMAQALMNKAAWDRARPKGPIDPSQFQMPQGQGPLGQMNMGLGGQLPGAASYDPNTLANVNFGGFGGAG